MVVRRLLALMRPHAGRLGLAVAASVAAELATLALMGTAAWMIARAAQQPPLAALSLAIVGVRAFATARGLFRYGERLASHDAALRALATLRGRVYDALVPLASAAEPRFSGEGGSVAAEPRFSGEGGSVVAESRFSGEGGSVVAESRFSGEGGNVSGAPFRSSDVLSRMVADVEAVQDFVVRVMVPVATAGVIGAVAVGFGVVALPVAGAVLAVGLLVAAVVVPLLTAAASRRAARQLAPARAELAARTVDLLQGSADLAVFGATETALADADRAGDQLARVERKATLTTAGASAAAMLVQAATTVGVTLLALGAASDGTLAPVMVPVLALVTLISFEPVLPLVQVVRHFLESRAAAARVMAVLDAPASIEEPAEPRPKPGRDAVIDVHGLTVRYSAGRAPALDGVDLRLEPGRRVAVVGVSGSGKSTLLAALMRFVEPESGAILVDGHDLAEYDGDDVRALITGVTQDSHLFHTTIRENLRLADPSASDEDMRAALASARLLDWVDALPKGLDTVVGESGGHVSGGQRQRLALARALLRDPPVLVLDEPTEGLDPETADELVSDLLASTYGRTTLLITHRLTGLEEVDEIVVLDAGRVAQRGRHAELVEEPGPYHDLWWASQVARGTSTSGGSACRADRVGHREHRNP